MRVAVAGSSGLIGTALRPALAAAGHEVVRLVRRAPAASDEVRWSPADRSIDVGGLGTIHAAINLAGVGIGDRRWSDAHKRAVLSSRVDSTSLLARTMAGLDPLPAVLLNASAIGFYGDRGDEELTEDSAGGDGFLAMVVREWEAATEPARAAGIRTVHMRNGLVLSGDGGLLPRTVLPFKLGVGGTIGSGDQYWSWIAIEDTVSATIHLLTAGLEGPVNLTAPNPVPFDVVRRALGRIFRRPTFWPVPNFALKLALGSERAQELLFAGQRVLPARLEESGFEFRFTELEPALRHALGRPA